MIKDEIQTLRQSIFILSKRDEFNLLSYWSGYFQGNREKRQKITNLIGNYLKKRYGINSELTDWIEQIEHYSYLKGAEWFDGFYIGDRNY